MPTMRRTTVWVDAQGKTTAHLLTTAAGAGAVESEIDAVSNAGVLETWEGVFTVNATPGAIVAPYDSVRDRAVLVFQTASGATARIVVPAPDGAIFMADGETVDPATITALIAAVLADAVTTDGTALTAYVAGFRSHS
jgi:hypothetical protein